MRKRMRAKKPATALPDIGLGKLLRRAHMSFAKEFRIRLAARGMTFGEFVHLERLWDQDGLNQTELSRRVGIATASSTKIIETLEKRGFIRRVRSDDDRRNIIVHLTAAGAAIKTALLECAHEVNVLGRTGLTAGQTMTLFQLLRQVAGNLERAAGDARPRGKKTRTGTSRPASRSSARLTA